MLDHRDHPSYNKKHPSYLTFQTIMRVLGKCNILWGIKGLDLCFENDHMLLNNKNHIISCNMMDYTMCLDNEYLLFRVVTIKVHGFDKWV